MTLQPDIAKAATGAAVSILGWIGTTIDQIPAWIREFGLPLVMLAGAIVAIVFLYRELRAERKSRIEDRDSFIKLMREDAAKGEASRDALLRATLEQTNEFKNLRRELGSRE
ncbi:hypothetical protein OKA05_02140 [Luteolibacter arcticus]|uniref:Holin n=1 Tax=Luteolibacter arcticus TaxID=1581411 RepID=A0ABT3GDJ4_9BACT|nr:hypothetical protein [Luteolibacter arcticus]MCW1921333.1 hypothetical protein [Luteolibacter arcticus]